MESVLQRIMTTLLIYIIQDVLSSSGDVSIVMPQLTMS